MADEGFSLFICRRGQRTTPCDTPGCGKPHVALCDYPLNGAKKGKTCDRKMCKGCRFRQPGRDVDFCMAHDKFAREQAAMPVPPPLPSR